jgi:hypothetical protein
MPIPQIFYLNAPSLGSATAVFFDAALTVCADDGYYSDGLITREQVGCSLLPQQSCPSCGTACSPLFNVITNSQKGIYNIDVNTGTNATDVGAIIIEFYPNSIPNGISVDFNGNYYNEVSSETFGYLAASTISDFTYLGDAADNCGFVGSSSFDDFDVYGYDYNTSTFIGTGGTLSVSSGPTSDQLTLASPDKCIMVIPKLDNSFNSMTIRIITPCEPDSDGSNISVSCPALLRSFTGSTEENDDIIRCALPTNVTYYVAPVNGVNPYLGLADWIFTDAYGENKLADGIYKTNFLTLPNDTIEVQDGVIISISQTC